MRLALILAVTTALSCGLFKKPDKKPRPTPPIENPDPLPPIPLLEQWESQMVEFGNFHCTNGDDTWEGWAWYYDGIWVYHQIADYLDDDGWHTCADHHKGVYRSYVLAGDTASTGWRIFPHGLYEDWLRTQEEDSRRALLRLAYESPYAFLGGDVDEEFSRETAYMIQAWLYAEKLGEPENIGYMQSVEWAFGHIDQWFVERSSPDWAPFMFAITAHALIEHWEKTNDPRVLPALRLGCDELWEQAWLPDEETFWMRLDDPTPSPDLNLLIAPIYTWVWKESGIAGYREMGDAIFAGGVSGAFLEGGKQFSQSYRLSFKFLEWRR